MTCFTVTHRRKKRQLDPTLFGEDAGDTDTSGDSGGDGDGDTSGDGDGASEASQGGQGGQRDCEFSIQERCKGRMSHSRRVAARTCLSTWRGSEQSHR